MFIITCLQCIEIPKYRFVLVSPSFENGDVMFVALSAAVFQINKKTSDNFESGCRVQKSIYLQFPLLKVEHPVPEN